MRFLDFARNDKTTSRNDKTTSRNDKTTSRNDNLFSEMITILIFISAFLIRLINLNQSLWLDEAVVAKVVKTIPLLQIPFQFSPGDFHPPLYYMFMSVWSSVFGYSEIALRMPSILFSLIAGWFVFKIMSLIRDKKTGLWAAAFFLFNPIIIYYSQEARMYMMATVFLSVVLHYFLLLMKTTQSTNRHTKIKNILLFNLFSALAMLTFYGSIFFISGMIIASFFMIPKKRNFFPQLSIGVFISLLLLSPLLYQQIVNAKIGLLEVKNWSLVLGKAEIKNIALIFLKFATGRLSWYPKWSYYLFAGIPTVITWLFVVFGMKKNKLLAFIFFFPLCIGFVISFITPMMMYFRFLYLIPVMSILLGFGVISTKTSESEVAWRDLKDRDFSTSQSFARNDIKGIITILLFLVFSFLYLLNPQFHREDWKKLANDINSTQRVYMILPSADPVNYYNPDLSLFEVRKIQSAILPEYIQVIPYVEEIYGYNHTSILEKKGCVLETKSSYRGPLFLEKWKCPASFIGHASISAI